MAPDEASWATFMGQVLAPSKKIQIERKNTFLKWLLFLTKLLTARRPKHFAFVACQLVSAYHN